MNSKMYISLSSAKPLVIVLATILLVDLIVGDSQLCMYINVEMNNPILDFICVYGFSALFLIFALFSLIVPCLDREGGGKMKRYCSCFFPLFSGALSYWLGSGLKLIVRRPRPFEVLALRPLTIWQTNTFSFPSTTTMLVFSFTLPIFFEQSKLGVPLIITSTFIGFSLVYIGVHYPSDIIAGALLSIALTIFMIQLKPSLTRFLSKLKL